MDINTKMFLRRVRLYVKQKKLFLLMIAWAWVALLLFKLIVWGKFFAAHSQMQPVAGGIYTQATVGTLQHLNPLSPHQTQIDQDISQLIHQGLLKYNPQTATVENNVAELRLTEDAKVYKLTIGDDIRFSNGDRMTMEDVLFTFKSIIQSRVFPNRALREAFEYVTIQSVDERTVEFILPEQNIYFPYYLTTPILSEKAFRGVLMEELFDPFVLPNRRPVGLGPFRFKQATPKADGTFRIRLEKNPYYHQPSPAIEEIVFYGFPDEKSLEQSLAEVKNYASITGISTEGRLRIGPDLESDYQTARMLLPQYLAVFLNLDKSQTAKLALRKALYEGMNKESLLENEAGWERVDSPFFFENINTSYQQTNYKQARSYLRDNGFPYNRALEGRTIGKNGDPLKLTFITSTEPAVYSRLALNLVKTWEKELDIDFDLQILNPSDFATAVEERTYDLVLFGQNFSHSSNALAVWHSSQSGLWNLANLTREDVDFLIGEIRFSGGQSDFFSLSQKLDVVRPAIFLATPQKEFYIHQSIKNVPETWGRLRSFSQRFLYVDQWFMEKKLVWTVTGWDKFMAFWRWVF